MVYLFGFLIVYVAFYIIFYAILGTGYFVETVVDKATTQIKKDLPPEEVKQGKNILKICAVVAISVIIMSNFTPDEVLPLLAVVTVIAIFVKSSKKPKKSQKKIM